MPECHQARGPSPRMIAGSRTSRITVASSTTAKVSPAPNCCSEAMSAVAKTRKTELMITAAPVITPAVWRRPCVDRLDVVLASAARPLACG